MNQLAENPREKRCLNIRERECDAITVLNKTMDARSKTLHRP